MSHIKRSALVHYSPSEMYQLVNDVDRYASFLPWCRSSEVKSESATEMVASVEIAKGILNKTFTTHNQLYKDQRIELQLIDGPFKKLSGYWQFDALKTANACKVNLELDFEFDNAMMSIAAKPIFTQIANSLVDSFCKRAVQVYGERG
ncbi:Putative oligoketide cyclase/lipid transport protein, similarity with yeast ubiquinone-binding protein YOL008W [hydrothermal vent metagenome]|uniref:Oligoketide cyclase/lipid transport protein, similarity with yeast ubiquinone-binding protein YOL008W n=1 Tax=hydrothermal vent metagenome TaxID=652676 RepID=A0A3B0W9J7_9ZZZZ